MEYRRSAIRRRCAEARGCVTALIIALSRAEVRLNRSSLSLEEMRRHIRQYGARASKLQRVAPKPVPVRSWSTMRSLEMGAYRRQLAAFNRWDSKMRTFIHDANVMVGMLNKLAYVKKRTKRVR